MHWPRLPRISCALLVPSSSPIVHGPGVCMFYLHPASAATFVMVSDFMRVHRTCVLIVDTPHSPQRVAHQVLAGIPDRRYLRSFSVYGRTEHTTEDL